LILYDTRPSSNQEEMVLEGIAGIIYEYCDQGHTLPDILHHLKDLGEQHLPSRDEGTSFQRDEFSSFQRDEFSSFQRDEFSSFQDEREVQKLLTSLVEKRVMLHVDDRYLSLAIPMQDRAQEFIEHFVASITP
jgi:hypothetical protein